MPSESDSGSGHRKERSVASLAAKSPTRVATWRVALGLGLTVALFFFLFRFVDDSGELWSSAKSLRKVPLLLALGTSSLAVLTTAFRMRLALLVCGDEVPYGVCLRAVLSAWPISVITPSRAGDFYRAALLKHRVPLARGLGAVLAEKIVDAIVLFFVAGVGAWVADHRLLAGVCFAGSLAGLAAVLAPSWLDLILSVPLPEAVRLKLREATAASRELHSKPLLLALLGSASMFVIAVACAHLWMILIATGSSVTLEEVIRYWPLSMVAGALPLTPAGMATRDAAFVFLLGQRAAPEVVLATLLYALTAWVYALVGAPLLLRSGVLQAKSKGTLPPDETRSGGRQAGKG